MTKPEELAKEYLAHFVAEDGGGMLTPEDSRPPFSGELRTTGNENPILFLVQAACEFTKYLPGTYNVFRELFTKHMRTTEIWPGLHSRRAGDQVYINQSHDNIVAQAIGSWFFRTLHVKTICEYGTKNSWCFNVQRPGLYDIKYILQGGDIAICQLANDSHPEIWNTAWLSGGLATSSAWNLADLRLEFLFDRNEFLSPMEKAFLGTGSALHKIRRGDRLKWIQSYYKPNHPFRMLVEFVESNNGEIN